MGATTPATVSVGQYSRARKKDAYRILLRQGRVLVRVYCDKVKSLTAARLDLGAVGELLEDGREHLARAAPAGGAHQHGTAREVGLGDDALGVEVDKDDLFLVCDGGLERLRAIAACGAEARQGCAVAMAAITGGAAPV